MAATSAGSEAGIAALGGDGVDHLRAVSGIPAVHDDIGAVRLLALGPLQEQQTPKQDGAPTTAAAPRPAHAEEFP